jgi:tetraprenyl-beta-curcumene synthase
MSAATQTRNGRIATVSTIIPAREARQRTRYPAGAPSLELSRAFAGIVAGFLLHVLPAVHGELARWRTLTAAIPSPGLRASAEEALGKCGNIEGAALFATLVPAMHRAACVRALVAFQSAYNYLDALSERDGEEPALNAEQLHQALLCALRPGAAHVDYYAHSPERDDGGYLHALLDTCRDALAALPSYGVVAPLARAAAGRIVDFQTLNLDERHGGHRAMQAWASESTPPRSGLHWWETAAACGSSLSVHGLIAAAASPHLDPAQARAIDHTYFPWAGALHSLLDSVVDRDEDRDGGRPCLLDHYGSSAYTAARLAVLAGGADDAARALERTAHHRTILTAMCSYYLSAPRCDAAEVDVIARALSGVLGLSLGIAIVMFRARRIAKVVLRRPYS